LFERLLRRGDHDEDGQLSHDEFLAALIPSRPQKTLEEKQPSTSPEASAVRWLLLSIDTNANGWIEEAEVPEELEPTFDAMAERLDIDKNATIDTRELYRGGRPLAQIAGRYVRQNGIEVQRQLKQLERLQGAAANRFDERRGPLENLADPQRARQLFAQLDADRDERLEPREVPEPLQRPFQRLFRTADRDGNGVLSQREFLAGARRITARMARPSESSMPAADGMTNESMPAKP
jgi:Ca2+-binding EF-hand superfamily protein